MLKVTPEQIGMMTADQARALMPPQLAVWKGPQVAAIKPAIFGVLSLAQLRSFNKDAWPSMTTAQFEQVPADIAKQLSPRMIGRQYYFVDARHMGDLLPAGAKELDPQDIAVIRVDVIRGIRYETLKALTDAQVQAFTTPQLLELKKVFSHLLDDLGDNLSVAQLGAMGVQSLAATSLEANPGAATAAAIGRLKAVDIAFLSVATLNALPPAAVAAFSPTQLGFFSDAQIAGLSPAFVKALRGLDGFAPEQLKLLNPAVFAGLTAEQVRGLKKAQWEAVTLAQLAQLPWEIVKQVSESMLGLRGYLLSPMRISEISDQALRTLTPDLIRPIPPATIVGLSLKQLGVLTDAQVQAMTADQLKALAKRYPRLMEAIGDNLSGDQVVAAGLQSIYLTDLIAKPASASAYLIQHLKPLDILAIPPTALVQLSEAAVHAFTPAQVATWTSAQVGAITPAFVSLLTPSQMGALTAQQITTLPPAVFAAMSTEQFKALTKAQWRVVSVAQLEQVPIAIASALPYSSLGAQYWILSRVRLERIPVNLVPELTTADIAAIDPRFVDTLSREVLQVLTVAQLQAMTGAQLLALSKTPNFKLIENKLSAAQVQALAAALKQKP